MRTLIAPLLALAVTAGTLSAVAQTKSKSSRSKDDTEEKSKYHRLPTYFGKLELKDDQVEEIYGIKDEYGPQIDKLKAELEELQQEMNEEIEDVLTTTQKSALSKLRSDSGSSRSSSRKSSSRSSSSKK